MFYLPYPDLSDFDGGDDLIERCGLLLSDNKGLITAVSVPNRHKDTRNHFQINNDDVNNIVNATRKAVIGILHTHPQHTTAKPTQSDIYEIPVGFIGMVYHPSSKTITWYDSIRILKSTIRK